MKRHCGAIAIRARFSNEPAVIATISLPVLILFFVLFCAPAVSRSAETAGLWFGQIEITQVSEVGHPTDTVTPTDVAHPFDMSILLHAEDSNDDQVPETTRLLKKVTVMGERYTVDNGDGTVEERIRRVLLTDDSLLAGYEGVIRRDGKMVGIRLGSAGFQFDPDSDALDLTGTIGLGQLLEGAIALDPDHPVNPFRHKYHPDHRSGYEISRTFRLTFDPAANPDDPESGVEAFEGDYEETIEGLHKIPINIKGHFTINRVSLVPTLNDQ